jgi:hypothetical protein
MPEVGSQEWIAAFDRAVADLDPRGVAVSVAHRIEGGPAWVVASGADGVRVRSAAPDEVTDVVFTWQPEDAEAVARGDMAPLAAFQAGRLRIGGDLRRLPEVADLFARLPAVSDA